MRVLLQRVGDSELLTFDRVHDEGVDFLPDFDFHGESFSYLMLIRKAWVRRSCTSVICAEHVFLVAAAPVRARTDRDGVRNACTVDYSESVGNQLLVVADHRSGRCPSFVPAILVIRTGARSFFANSPFISIGEKCRLASLTAVLYSVYTPEAQFSLVWRSNLRSDGSQYMDGPDYRVVCLDDKHCIDYC